MPNTAKIKLEKACQFLIIKAAPSYNKDTCGHCARAVRMAVDFGFDGINIKQVQSAKDYGASYETIGFKKVFSYPEKKIIDYKPVVGDICIIQPVVENGKIIHPHGHICMFTKLGWISDFRQRDVFGGGIRDKNPSFCIYRYE
tara:strand:+ start:39 stop:467 length:429 start_codon:yes stop_codon:yes gene_type:complete